MARFIPYHAKGAFLEPTQETINGLEEAIEWAEVTTPKRLRHAMDNLVRYMAIINQGYARRMSFGVYDPSENNPDAAWKVPVRRITNTYYLSWKVRRVKQGVYQLYNDSREAYYIEFGINWLGGGRRVRRPVRKLSLRQTMNFLATTQVYHRVWCDIYAPNGGKHSRGFTQIVQSPAGGHEKWVDVSDKELNSALRGITRGGKGLGHMRRVNGRWQKNVGNAGGGSYSGRRLGRRLP